MQQNKKKKFFKCMHSWRKSERRQACAHKHMGGVSNHAGTASAKPTLTDLDDVPLGSYSAKRHVGNLCNRDNTSAGSTERDQTKQRSTTEAKGGKRNTADEL